MPAASTSRPNDVPSGPVPSPMRVTTMPDDGNTTTGVIRYRVTASNKDTLKFLIMPIY